uniref:Uncharacterized protein n=1 Tax=Varanus komodoensis TaxID=61221 RepID=A0A8D2L834_VARKO
MEAGEGVQVRERGRTSPGPGPDAGVSSVAAAEVSARGPPLSGTSYWLDFWLLILFDLVLFIFVYLLP